MHRWAAHLSLLVAAGAGVPVPAAVPDNLGGIPLCGERAAAEVVLVDGGIRWTEKAEGDGRIVASLLAGPFDLAPAGHRPTDWKIVYLQGRVAVVYAGWSLPAVQRDILGALVRGLRQSRGRPSVSRDSDVAWGGDERVIQVRWDDDRGSVELFVSCAELVAAWAEGHSDASGDGAP
jgi:hypothetical protein